MIQFVLAYFAVDYGGYDVHSVRVVSQWCPHLSF
jgi:hypothetical protein